MDLLDCKFYTQTDLNSLDNHTSKLQLQTQMQINDKNLSICLRSILRMNVNEPYSTYAFYRYISVWILFWPKTACSIWITFAFCAQFPVYFRAEKYMQTIELQAIFTAICSKQTTFTGHFMATTFLRFGYLRCIRHKCIWPFQTSFGAHTIGFGVVYILCKLQQPWITESNKIYY